jgi:hypothetical protein
VFEVDIGFQLMMGEGVGDRLYYVMMALNMQQVGVPLDMQYCFVPNKVICMTYFPVGSEIAGSYRGTQPWSGETHAELEIQERSEVKVVLKCHWLQQEL